MSHNLFLAITLYPEDVLIEHSNHFKWYEWGHISKYQKLSEEFIRKFKDKLDWEYISLYQELSFEFIIEQRELINPDWLKDNRYLSHKERVKLKLMGLIS